MKAGRDKQWLYFKITLMVRQIVCGIAAALLTLLLLVSPSNRGAYNSDKKFSITNHSLPVRGESRYAAGTLRSR